MAVKKKKHKEEKIEVKTQAETEVKTEVETKAEDQPMESSPEESASETKTDSKTDSDFQEVTSAAEKETPEETGESVEEKPEADSSLAGDEDKSRITLVAVKDTPEETKEPVEGKPEESSLTEEEGKSEGSGDFKKYLIISLIVGLIVALVGGGIFVYTRSLNLEEAPVLTSEPIPTPEVILSQSPEASSTAELNREDLVIQVLNGRGVPGTAAEAKEFLEGLGYSDVAAGTADNYDYEQTVIQIKEDKTDYLNLLTEDLSTDYTVNEETETLDPGEDFDVIIIIGKK